MKKKAKQSSRASSGSKPKAGSISKLQDWQPHEYQKKAIKFMVSQGAAGLFADPGLGKTSMTLGAFKVLKQQGLVDAMVVVAPLLVCYNVWPREAKKWRDFNQLKVRVLHGPNKMVEASKDADIYVINPEAIEWLHDNWPKKWDKLSMMLVIDESTKFKNYSSIRFKAMRGGTVTRKDSKKTFKPLLKKFTRRYILTGTPAPNGLIDLWAQVFMLDFGGKLGQYVSHYRHRWFYPTGYGGYEWAPQAGAEDEIYDHLDDLVLRLDAKDYLDLPPLVGDITGMSGKAQAPDDDTGIIRIEMPTDVRKAYDELEKEFITELEGGHEITAQTAAVVSGRLRQLANGGIYLDRKENKVKHLHNLKAEMTAELIEELNGKPALVAYEFNHDLERLLKVLGKKTPYIGKGASGKESQRLVDAWNRGDLPVLLGQPASMSHGLNMQDAGRAVIWHSPTWNYESYVQFTRRIWRQGQTESVFLYHIVMEKTIDEAVLQALRSKAKTENGLLDALREYTKMRGF